MMPDRLEIEAFGTRFSSLDTAGALVSIVARPVGAPFAYVCTPNAVHVVNYERGEPRFRAGIDGAWLRLCDSRVVARMAALVLGTRLPLALGSDLTLAMVHGGVEPRRCHDHHRRHRRDGAARCGRTHSAGATWHGTIRRWASSPTRRRSRSASISCWPTRPATCS